jgi:hypothetical protein
MTTRGTGGSGDQPADEIGIEGHGGVRVRGHEIEPDEPAMTSFTAHSFLHYRIESSSLYVK